MSLARFAYMSRPTASNIDAFNSHRAEIVMQARANNLRNRLTGSLLGNQDWFLQVLEGPSQNVMAALNKILVDPRHKDVLLFEMAVARDRMFENWSMHYSSLDDVDPAIVRACVDDLWKGSVSGGRSAIHLLTQAADRSVNLVAA